MLTLREKEQSWLCQPYSSSSSCPCSYPPHLPEDTNHNMEDIHNNMEDTHNNMEDTHYIMEDNNMGDTHNNIEDTHNNMEESSIGAASDVLYLKKKPIEGRQFRINQIEKVNYRGAILGRFSNLTLFDY